MKLSRTVENMIGSEILKISQGEKLTEVEYASTTRSGKEIFSFS